MCGGLASSVRRMFSGTMVLSAGHRQGSSRSQRSGYVDRVLSSPAGKRCRAGNRPTLWQEGEN